MASSTFPMGEKEEGKVQRDLLTATWPVRSRFNHTGFSYILRSYLLSDWDVSASLSQA